MIEHKPIKHRILADKLDELDEIEGVKPINDNDFDFMKSFRVPSLTENEKIIIDWLSYNNGETLEFVLRCQNRNGWKISKEELQSILQSLIGKRWAREINGRYFVDERTYL